MGRKFSFPAKYRLKSRKSIEEVFSSGQSLLHHPVLCKYVILNEQAGELRVAFAVPRKNFRKAVERNRIKRLMREAFRLLRPDQMGNMEGLCGLHLMLICIDRKMPVQEEISAAMSRMLKGLRARIGQIPEANKS